MKRYNLIAAAIILFTIMMVPIGAVETVAETTAVEVTTANSGQDSDNKAASAALLLTGVIGAMVVSVLIYRGRDKGKYL